MSTSEGGGLVVVNLEPEITISPDSHFCLVFEGRSRRHLASCLPVGRNYFVAHIPEHDQEENLHVLLVQSTRHQDSDSGKHRPQLHSQSHPVHILANLPFAYISDWVDCLAGDLLHRLVDPGRPPVPHNLCVWLDLLAASAPPETPTRRRLLFARDFWSSLEPDFDRRFSAALQRLIRDPAGEYWEKFASIAESEPSDWSGRETGLHLAARYGLVHLASLLFILVRGSPIWFVANADGLTPSQLADEQGFVEFAQILISPSLMQEWIMSGNQSLPDVDSASSWRTPLAAVQTYTESGLTYTTDKERLDHSVEDDVMVHRSIEDVEKKGQWSRNHAEAINGSEPVSQRFGLYLESPMPCPGSEPESARGSAIYGTEPAAGAEQEEVELATANDSSGLALHVDKVLENSAQQLSPSALPPATDSPSSLASTVDVNSTSAKSVNNCAETGTSAPPAPIASDLLTATRYLADYPSWQAFRGRDGCLRCTARFILRNDNIWELLSGERGYLAMLVMMRDVYMQHYPAASTSVWYATNSINPGTLASTHDLGTCAEMFPCLEDMIETHAGLLAALVALHRQREDCIVHELAPTLLQMLTGPNMENLSRVYGSVLFAQRRIKERIHKLKKYPTFAQYLQRCEKDARNNRKTLEDCYTVITQRWTKVETLIDAISKNTTNNAEEVEHLDQAKSAVRELIKRAESILGDLQNAEQLSHYVERLVPPVETPCKEEAELRTAMRLPTAQLVNHGRLRVENRRGTKVHCVEVHGVALRDYFFLLQEISESNKTGTRYQLYREGPMPAFLLWGEVYGYFRETVVGGAGGKDLGFFLILERPQPSIVCFHCDTPDERARWKRTLLDGFARWNDKGGQDTPAVVSLESVAHKTVQRVHQVKQKWDRTESALDLMRCLDACLIRDWEMRTAGFSAILTDRLKESQRGGESSPSDKPGGNGDLSTFLPEVNPSEELDQWLAVFQEYVARLKFALASNGSSLTRSASDVEERKKPSLPVRKIETFGVYDVSYDKRPSIASNEPPTSAKLDTKQKRDSRRFSVSNFFRSGSREKSLALSSPVSPCPSFPASGSSPCSVSLLSTSPSGNTGLSLPLDSPVSHYRQSEVAGPLVMTLEEDETPTSSQGQQSGSGTASEKAGSSTSLFSFPLDGVVSLDQLNRAAEKLCSAVYTSRTRQIELEATIARLKEDKSCLEAFRSAVQARYPELVGDPSVSAAPPARFTSSVLQVESGMGPVGGEGRVVSIAPFTVGPDNSDLQHHLAPIGLKSAPGVRQENEKLRQMYEEFARLRRDWDKEYRRQRAAIERANEDLAEEKQRIAQEQAELERWRELQRCLDSTSTPSCNVATLAPTSPTLLHMRSHSDDVTDVMDQQDSPIRCAQTRAPPVKRISQSGGNLLATAASVTSASAPGQEGSRWNQDLGSPVGRSSVAAVSADNLLTFNIGDSPTLPVRETSQYREGRVSTCEDGLPVRDNASLASPGESSAPGGPPLATRANSSPIGQLMARLTPAPADPSKTSKPAKIKHSQKPTKKMSFFSRS